MKKILVTFILVLTLASTSFSSTKSSPKPVPETVVNCPEYGLMLALWMSNMFWYGMIAADAMNYVMFGDCWTNPLLGPKDSSRTNSVVVEEIAEEPAN